MPPISLQGRVAIVTGAGGGLGRAHALELARRGAKLVVNDLGPGAESVAKEIRAAGGEALAHLGSVTDPGAVAALADSARSAFGRIDLLVANAGVLRDKSFGKMDAADFLDVLDVHVAGTFHCVKAVWEGMRAQGFGRIVVTTSSSGLYGNFGQANYAAAKLALVGLMKTLAIEGAKYDIKANALSPVAATAMTEGLLPSPLAAALKPELVAPAVAFLCSDGAPTGQILTAGAGVFALARIVETEGVFLGAAPSAEAIAERWAEIADPAGQEPYSEGAGQTQKFMRRAAGA